MHTIAGSIPLPSVEAQSHTVENTMQPNTYLMESDEEIIRLEVKTERSGVEEQALWAGIKPGMRVADIGCGSGITTAILHGLVQPTGTVTGVDRSSKRINHAGKQYGAEGLEFVCRDILAPLDDLGKFDFIWVRFLLEYYRTNSFELVTSLSHLLNPGGIMCLIDLDHNCLNHFGLSDKLERNLFTALKILEEQANFDPYAGRKLYSYLYDLDFLKIDVNLAAHHLIFGDLKESDAYNWMKKIEVVSEKLDFSFEDEAWGPREFAEEFEQFFNNPRRFTYTPVIMCRGIRP